jgi:cytochrome P450
MLGGNLPHQIKAFHDTYGGIVRVAPDELSFIETEAWKDIYVSRLFVRPKQWGTRPPGIKAHNLISAPQADHLRYRKALSPAFSEKAVKLQEPIIKGYVDDLITKMQDAVSQSPDTSTVIDMVRWTSFTTFDIASDLGWGTSLKCLETQEYHPWVSIILHYKALIFGVFFKYYPFLDRLVSILTPKSAMDGLNFVIDTSQINVRKRLASKSPRPDFMSYILAFNEETPSQALSNDEMVAASMTLIVAGSDSVSTVLSGTINHLIQSPQTLSKLVEEVRSAFEAESSIDAASVKHLPFLNAVLQEGLRLCPPTPDSMRRAVPVGGTTIAGHFVPDGVSVGISCYAAFNSRENFPRPDEFLPERWLVDFEGTQKEAYHPFGVGPRQCMGQLLAWVELRVILARLVWNFDMAVPEGKRPLQWSQQEIYWAWNKVGVEVSIRSRID